MAEEVQLRQDTATLRGGDGGGWPINTGPGRGLGGDLLGGWAEAATCGCSSSVAGSGGYLATPPTFATCSRPIVPFNTYSHLCSHLAGFGCSCSFLATCGCPYSHPTPSRVMPAGGLAKWA